MERRKGREARCLVAILEWRAAVLHANENSEANGLTGLICCSQRGVIDMSWLHKKASLADERSFGKIVLTI